MVGALLAGVRHVYRAALGYEVGRSLGTNYRGFGCQAAFLAPGLVQQCPLLWVADSQPHEGFGTVL